LNIVLVIVSSVVEIAFYGKIFSAVDAVVAQWAQRHLAREARRVSFFGDERTAR
jgi:hypothetical protein